MVHPLKRDWYIFYTYILARQRRPFLASFKVTYRCNLRCRQCPFVGLEDRQPGFDELVAVLDRLYARGDRIVIFEGGEPLLWRDGAHTLHDLVRYARRRFFCVGLTTNGTLPLDVESDVVWVSFDGFKETHNRLRGRPVFDQIVENVRRSSHPRLYAHLTANAENADELPDLVRWLKDLVKGVTIQFYYPYGAEDHLFLDFERRSRLLDELITLKQKGYPILNSHPSLLALKRNTWRCVPWLVDNANPDGSIDQGCYLQGRARVDCSRCGFSPYTEISLAYQWNLQAVQAGIRIFFS